MEGLIDRADKAGKKDNKKDKKLRLRVLTPRGSLCDQDVDYVIFRSTEGDAGIQIGHEPFTATLNEGLLIYRVNSEAHTLVVLGGAASVLDDEVTVVSEIADRLDRIKQTINELAREKAALAKEEQKGSTDIQIMELGLRRALVRMDVSAYSIIKGRAGVVGSGEDKRGDGGNQR